MMVSDTLIALYCDEYETSERLGEFMELRDECEGDVTVAGGAMWGMAFELVSCMLVKLDEVHVEIKAQEGREAACSN